MSFRPSSLFGRHISSTCRHGSHEVTPVYDLDSTLVRERYNLTRVCSTEIRATRVSRVLSVLDDAIYIS